MMSTVYKLRKLLTVIIAPILLLGVLLAGFFVQNLHIAHAATMSHNPIITCDGNIHSTDKTPCPSVKYQNVIAAISTHSHKFSPDLDSNTSYDLPLVAQYIIPTALLYKIEHYSSSRSFEKKNNWITQLPRAHLS